MELGSCILLKDIIIIIKSARAWGRLRQPANSRKSLRRHRPRAWRCANPGRSVSCQLRKEMPQAAPETGQAQCHTLDAGWMVTKDTLKLQEP